MSFKYPRNFIITPKKVVLFAFGLFLIVVLGYFWREIGFLVQAPKLEVLQPPTDISTTERTIKIIGKTESTAFLLINDQEIYLDKEGNFETELNLFDGTNTIKIESKNRFNKVNTIIRRVIYNK